ncbi:MAG: TonB-dependent receptor [Gammaproteobacteria bacterium]|nr:MAG: TonB-dependent receptor [Gammaproteobacteria bacterium]
MTTIHSQLTAAARRVTLFASVALLVVTPLLSSAVVAADGATALEEITVFSTRRATDLQSTPVAVTAIDSERIHDLFMHDIGAVALVTPNFSAAQITGFNAAGFAIRGASQTDILVYWEPPVGVLVDDFVIPHMQTQLLEPYDIETIEVLRGPQGTLFGKNTTAGVVSVRTKRPVMNDFGFDGSVLGGSYGRVEVRGALNVPIVDDTLSFRLAAISQESDGYYKNGKVSTDVTGFAGGFGDYVGDGRDLGGDDAISARAKLLWTPTDKLEILFQYEYLKDRGDTPPAVNETDPASAQLFNLFGLPGVTSGDPLDQAGVTFYDDITSGGNAGQSTGLNLAGGHQIDVDGYYLNIDWEFGNYQLTSITGYREQDSTLPSTYTGEVGNAALNSVFDATRDDHRETFQQEIRIASNYDGPFNFVTGVFYQTDETSFNVLQYLGIVDLFGTGVPGVIDDSNPLIISNNQDMDSIAGFFDASYDINDTWTVAGGLRYTHEEKDFFSRPGTVIVAYGETPGGYPFDPNDTSKYPCDVTNPFDCQTDSETWNEPTYRLMVSNQFNDDLYGYVSFAHGFKSGGYSDQAGSALSVPSSATRYDPEEADSLEFGLKADLWGGRARLNTAIFYVEYTDMQRATIVTTEAGLQETVVFNAAEVTAYGLELEGTALLSDGWTLNANIGYLNTEYDKFELDLDFDPTTPPTSLSGNDVTRAPEWQAGVDLIYDFQLGNVGDVRAMVGVYYEDESVFYYAVDLPSDGFPGGTPVPEFNTVLEDRTLVNASLTFTHSSGMWYASLFGKNLTDEIYKNSSQYVGGLWTFSTYAEPRVYGLELGVTL